MGFFSWKTSDTKKSIPNIHSDALTFPVRMLDDKNYSYVEVAYDGYGVFGGKDYYELVSEMNGKGTNREIGIALAFSGKPVKLPKLVTLLCKKKWEELPDSPICEAQGYFYEGINMGFEL